MRLFMQNSSPTLSECTLTPKEAYLDPEAYSLALSRSAPTGSAELVKFNLDLRSLTTQQERKSWCFLKCLRHGKLTSPTLQEGNLLWRSL
jgi:hypothetical protein